MSFNPKVSIVIPVFNGSNFLREAIESALSQTYKYIEVIVVNDGSNDLGQTELIAKSYGSKIRYFCKENGGVATALNMGIKESTGEYISWLSHDDLYCNNKIEVQVEFIRNANNPDIVTFSNYYVHNYMNDVKYEVIFDHEKEYSKIEMLKQLFKSSVHACSILFPKKCFEKIGLFSEELRTIQDYDFLFSMIKKNYIFYHIPQSLITTRHHKEQGTQQLMSDHIEELNILYKTVINNFIHDFRALASPDIEEFKTAMANRGLTKITYALDELVKSIEYINRIDNGEPVIWLYWENAREKTTPVIITYCHETIKRNNNSDFIVVTTNPENIRYYLPDLNDDYRLLNKIAHRADYLRFNLLYRYGGIWLDSDFISFKSLLPVVEKINKYGFVYTGYKMNDGKIFPIIHFLGAKKNNYILRKLIDNVDQTLECKVKNGIQPEWDEIGGYALMPLLDDNNSFIYDTSYFSKIDVHGYGQREMFLPIKRKITNKDNDFGQMLCFSVHSYFYNTMGEDILNMECYVSYLLKDNLSCMTRVTGYMSIHEIYKILKGKPLKNIINKLYSVFKLKVLMRFFPRKNIVY